MSPTAFLQFLSLSGLAAMLGGALFSGKVLWNMINIRPSYATDITDLLFFLAPLLLLIGLAGFCTLCAQRYGTLGKLGCFISLSGLAVGTIGSLVGVWIEPLRLAYWLGFRFLCIGLVLLGGSTIKAQALPGGWSAMPLALGLLGLGRALFMFFAVTMIPTGLDAPEAGDELGTFVSSWAGTLTSMLGVLFGLGWLCLGYALWTGKTEAT
jgi:hypothetical protein